MNNEIQEALKRIPDADKERFLQNVRGIERENQAFIDGKMREYRRRENIKGLAFIAILAVVTLAIVFIFT